MKAPGLLGTALMASVTLDHSCLVVPMDSGWLVHCADCSWKQHVPSLNLALNSREDHKKTTGLFVFTN